MNKLELRKLISMNLRKQGFRFQARQILPPANLNKEKVRRLHGLAVQHRIERSKPNLIRKEPSLLEFLASGNDIIPERIKPRLIEVKANSEFEQLFRYASLHWSIPVSSGYGRRIRFVVIDEQNGKLIGLFGLCDPVFSLADRDKWIGWDRDTKIKKLQNIMDAFILGAVPPYSFLLCGKLVAMLATSNEVSNIFKKKYCGKRTRIKNERLDGRLALISTTSALGRSSIYNRLKINGQLLYKSVGFTQGYGEFQFSNGLYGVMSEYAKRYCIQSDRKEEWGEGFRNRRELVKKCLSKVGLPQELRNHGIKREIFVIPLARNAQKFLRGENSKLLCFNRSSEELFEDFRERWLIPRSQWDGRYKSWQPLEWSLWNGQGKK